MKELTQKEFASRGGKSTLRKYGTQHLSDAAKKAKESQLKQYGGKEGYSKEMSRRSKLRIKNK